MALVLAKFDGGTTPASLASILGTGVKKHFRQFVIWADPDNSGSVYLGRHERPDQRASQAQGRQVAQPRAIGRPAAIRRGHRALVRGRLRGEPGTLGHREHGRLYQLSRPCSVKLETTVTRAWHRRV